MAESIEVPDKAKVKKKLLYLTVPMKGHIVHPARLAEFFLQFPDEYEIHVGSSLMVKEHLPGACIFHEMEELEGKRSFEQYLSDIMSTAMEKGTNWYHTQAIMMDGSDWEVVLHYHLFGLITIDKVRPDVVVIDSSYMVDNAMYSFCKHNRIPCICMCSQGRPETVIAPCNVLVMTCRYFRTIRSIMHNMQNVTAGLKKWLGPSVKLLPLWDPPLMVFPGPEFLSRPALGFEIYTGPFLPLPDLVEANKLMRSQSFNAKVAEDQGLAQFLHAGDGQPIVYLALGTLVRPSKEQVARIVDALDGGAWRVIWALPKQFQHLIPRALDKDKWLVMSFVPQFDLLRSGKVSAFLSHCGGNSTIESLCQGVPMVGMPFLGDQYEWCESMINQGCGLQVHKLYSSAAEIREALQKVVSTPSYKENAQRVKEKMVADARTNVEWLAKSWPAGNVTLQKNMKVGVPVAAAIVDAAARGMNPRDRMPPHAGRCCF